MVPDITAKEFIYNGLMGDKPFAVGRTGFGEIGLMSCARSEIYFHSRIHYYWTPSYIHSMDQYRENGDLLRFHKIQYDALDQLDCIGTYPEMFMSDAVLETLTNIKDIMIFDMRIYDTLAKPEYPLPWTKALEGKKVLVVSPFYKEIMIQYEKRNLLWPDGRIPEFDLSCDPSVWDLEHGGFFNALEILKDRVLKRDFDVALLGCGSSGVPIAAAIKKSGRKAVVLGSAIHLLFGLKGKRWDDKGIYNDYWITPGEDTRPSYSNDLDGSCYW